MESLVILGAGPKAAAVSAKLFVLKELGFDIPEVEIVDPHGVGANWLSLGGWTDGRQLLGTSPHKDVGFPYRTHIAGTANDEVDRLLLDLGWVRFLADTGRYAHWVDRGQPHPPHSMWAEYLQWVIHRTGATVRESAITYIDLTEASASTQRWAITAEDGRGERTTITADAVLLTGPGDSNSRIAHLPGVYSVADFWREVRLGAFAHAAQVVVIGGGESAASILDQLIKRDIDGVTVVSPTATMFSRGESQFENELYTNPEKWTQLSDTARRDFINRTDRGVLSVRVQNNLLLDDRIAHRRGYVTAVHCADSDKGDVSGSSVSADGGLAVHICDEITGDSVLRCDVVIDARGGNSLWFLDLFSETARAALYRSLRSVFPSGSIDWESSGDVKSAIERSIGHDLAVEALRPHLFIPALAAMRQGPGFANLSCLGELSDRIIASLGVISPPMVSSLMGAEV